MITNPTAYIDMGVILLRPIYSPHFLWNRLPPDQRTPGEARYYAICKYQDTHTMYGLTTMRLYADLYILLAGLDLPMHIPLFRRLR